MKDPTTDPLADAEDVEFHDETTVAEPSPVSSASKAVPAEPAALALPPTVIAEVEEDAGSAPLASVPTRTLGLPETVITAPIEEAGPSVSTLRFPAARTRPSALEIVGRVVVGAAMTFGVGVIVAHFVTSGAAIANGPLHVVVEASDTAPTTDAVTPRAADVDTTARLDTLERQAAEHLASGRLEEASEVYATLAARAPHQRAYGIAARILAERAQR
ncbi:hypothetical protein DB32_005459 [Sandaracinus amylolyticus]|uniref:Uncharacterized protein n=1 Tax=Sandaracinus amylolyticus TaxID=927083 RepID=A0A0F6YKF7_9BACT|nr:hypothetical protein DB32_005459 [Sandaracinus amylolyticus]